MVENFLELLGLALSIVLRSLAAGVCNIIYWLISRLFQLFMVVSQLNILSSEEVGPIYQRITLILTIVMVFYITFEFVKYVVQPDAMVDKEKGAASIVKRMIISIVLIAMVPTIFTFAYDVQNKLIRNQIFSKIILGKENINFDTFGSAFSADILGVFYELNEEACSGNNYDALCEEAEAKVESNLTKLREGNKVTLLPAMGYSKEMEVDGSIDNVFVVKFDGAMAIIVGGIILYLVVLYTIDVGTRYAQLIFLQIMSPIAIIGYISPKKDNIFSKWLKQCVTTYLDLFIRLSIIYFILLIIDALGTSFETGSLFAGVEGAEGFKTLAYIALVMGLLVFAKKAPKMIGELLPVSGGAASIGYGLKGGDRFSPTFGGVKKAWNAGKRTVGGVAGAAYGAYSAHKNKTGFWSGTKAAFRGLKAGAGKDGGLRKGQQAALASAKSDRDVLDKGGTLGGHDFRGVHYQRIKEETEREKSVLEETKKAKDTVSSATKDVKVMKNVASTKADWDNRSFGDVKTREGAVKAIEKATRVYAVSGQSDADKQIYRDSIGAALDQVYNPATHPTAQRLEANVKATTKRAEETTKAAEVAIANVAKYDRGNLTEEEKKERDAAIVIRDAAIKERDEAIKARNDSIVARDTELEVIKSERDVVYNNITSEIGSDPDKISELTTKIVEAKRIAEGTEYGPKDAEGKYSNKVPTRNPNPTIEMQELAKFAENIGDVADAADQQITTINADEKTRRANANAANTGK